MFDWNGVNALKAKLQFYIEQVKLLNDQIKMLNSLIRYTYRNI